MPVPKGTRIGGRQKGTPNRATAEVQAKLEALGCDPIEGMARLAMDETSSPELKGKMFSELAQYILPKRKAVEHSASDGQEGTALAIFTGIVRRPPREVC